VRYDQDHNIHDEWAHNGADIDRAKVFLSRARPATNAELLAYFEGRQISLVTPDSDIQCPEPHATGAELGSSIDQIAGESPRRPFPNRN
jgi:hypothetical protein